MIKHSLVLNDLTLTYVVMKALLLRWIVVVYNLIDNLGDVHSMYSILFLFLESDVLVS